MLSRVAAAVVSVVSLACSSNPSTGASATESPYLLLFAGDEDMAESDFLAVLDVQPGSPRRGTVIATTPIGMKNAMPQRARQTLRLAASSHDGAH